MAQWAYDSFHGGLHGTLLSLCRSQSNSVSWCHSPPLPAITAWYYILLSTPEEMVRSYQIMLKKSNLSSLEERKRIHAAQLHVKRKPCYKLYWEGDLLGNQFQAHLQLSKIRDIILLAFDRWVILFVIKKEIPPSYRVPRPLRENSPPYI